MTGSTLSLRLTEAGFEKDLIGWFALLGIPFSLKLLWAPLIDRYTLPFFQTAPRKGWMIYSLLGMAGAIAWLGFLQPENSSSLFAIALGILSLFTGSFYMTGLSYEIESQDESQYGKSSPSLVAGYRIGLLFAGAGMLYLAILLDWQNAFYIAALVPFFGAILIFLSPEPFRSKDVLQSKRKVKENFFQEMILHPIKQFLGRSDWMSLLFLLFAFKLGDQLTKTMEGPFYLSMGFTKADLALASKIWGFGATLLGAFFAAFLLKGKDPVRACILYGSLHALSLSSNAILALTGKSQALLFLISALENLTGGLAMSAFLYLLWKIANKKYASVQYALLWSLFSLKGNLFACLGGQLAEVLPWHLFFICGALLGTITLLACPVRQTLTQKL